MIWKAEHMARKLRKEAIKIVLVLGMPFLELLATRLGALSNLAKAFALLPDDTDAFEDAYPTREIFIAFMADLFPEDKETNLSAVMDSCTLILESVPPWQKKPIIVIGA
jgi:hypothetical protein